MRFSDQLSPAAVKRHTARLPTVGRIALWLNLVPSYVNLESHVEEDWPGLPPPPSLSNGERLKQQLGNLISVV